MARLSGTARIAQRRIQRLQRLRPGTPSYKRAALAAKQTIERPGVRERLREAGVSVPQDVERARPRVIKTESYRRARREARLISAAQEGLQRRNITAQQRAALEATITRTKRKRLGRMIESARKQAGKGGRVSIKVSEGQELGEGEFYTETPVYVEQPRAQEKRIDTKKIAEVLAVSNIQARRVQWLRKTPYSSLPEEKPRGYELFLTQRLQEQTIKARQKKIEAQRVLTGEGFEPVTYYPIDITTPSQVTRSEKLGVDFDISTTPVRTYSLPEEKPAGVDPVTKLIVGISGKAERLKGSPNVAALSGGIKEFDLYLQGFLARSGKEFVYLPEKTSRYLAGTTPKEFGKKAGAVGTFLSETSHKELVTAAGTAVAYKFATEPEKTLATAAGTIITTYYGGKLIMFVGGKVIKSGAVGVARVTGAERAIVAAKLPPSPQFKIGAGEPKIITVKETVRLKPSQFFQREKAAGRLTGGFEKLPVMGDKIVLGREITPTPYGKSIGLKPDIKIAEELRNPKTPELKALKERTIAHELRHAKESRFLTKISEPLPYGIRPNEKLADIAGILRARIGYKVTRTKKIYDFGTAQPFLKPDALRLRSPIIKYDRFGNPYISEGLQPVYKGAQRTLFGEAAKDIKGFEVGKGAREYPIIRGVENYEGVIGDVTTRGITGDVFIPKYKGGKVVGFRNVYDQPTQRIPQEFAVLEKITGKVYRIGESDVRITEAGVFVRAGMTKFRESAGFTFLSTKPPRADRFPFSYGKTTQTTLDDFTKIIGLPEKKRARILPGGDTVPPSIPKGEQGKGLTVGGLSIAQIEEQQALKSILDNFPFGQTRPQFRFTPSGVSKRIVTPIEEVIEPIGGAGYKNLFGTSGGYGVGLIVSERSVNILDPDLARNFGQVQPQINLLGTKGKDIIDEESITGIKSLNIQMQRLGVQQGQKQRQAQQQKVLSLLTGVTAGGISKTRISTGGTLITPRFKKIPFPSFDFDLEPRKKRKRGLISLFARQPKRRTPTLTAVVFGIKGARNVFGERSGFGLRPILNKKI